MRPTTDVSSANLMMWLELNLAVQSWVSSLQSCADPLSFMCRTLSECFMLTVLQFYTCLLVFPLRGGFCSSLFYFIIKITISLHLSPRPHLSWQNGSATMRTQQRGQPATMGPGRKILDVHQGDRTIENYARDFVGVVRQSATEKACLMVFFWGGLAEPFMSRMPYWHP